MAGTSRETYKEDYGGVFASYVTRGNSACPKKKFKARSPLILKHSENMGTKDPS